MMIMIGRGAFMSALKVRREPEGGAFGNADVGISNDKGGLMPPRRKTKVSRATLTVPGLAGP